MTTEVPLRSLPSVISNRRREIFNDKKEFKVKGFSIAQLSLGSCRYDNCGATPTTTLSQHDRHPLSFRTKWGILNTEKIFFAKDPSVIQLALNSIGMTMGGGDFRQIPPPFTTKKHLPKLSVSPPENHYQPISPHFPNLHIFAAFHETFPQMPPNLLIIGFLGKSNTRFQPQRQRQDNPNTWNLMHIKIWRTHSIGVVFSPIRIKEVRSLHLPRNKCNEKMCAIFIFITKRYLFGLAIFVYWTEHQWGITCKRR